MQQAEKNYKAYFLICNTALDEVINEDNIWASAWQNLQ